LVEILFSAESGVSTSEWSRYLRQKHSEPQTPRPRFGVLQPGDGVGAASTLVFWPSWMMIRDSAPGRWLRAVKDGGDAVAIVRAESLVIVQVLFRSPGSAYVRTHGFKELVPIRGEGIHRTVGGQEIGASSLGHVRILSDDVADGFPFIVWGTQSALVNS